MTSQVPVKGQSFKCAWYGQPRPDELFLYHSKAGEAPGALMAPAEVPQKALIVHCVSRDHPGANHCGQGARML